MFRTSIVHLQEGSCAVCCNLVCLDTSCCYKGEGRTNNPPEDGLLKSETCSATECYE